MEGKGTRGEKGKMEGMEGGKDKGTGGRKGRDTFFCLIHLH